MDEALFNTRIIKSDVRLWEKHPYTIVEYDELTPTDQARILELYNSLAIESHSKHNPQIRESYIDLAKSNHGFKIKALKRNGQIEGVVGYLTKGPVMTCLLFGYDKTKEDAPNLYRIMSTMLLLEAKKNGMIFHQSSGATFYKHIRRAQSFVENQAVFTSHLPAKQKATWTFLRTIMTTVAVRLMKRY